MLRTGLVALGTEFLPNPRHRPLHTASHEERAPRQTPTRAVGGKKAGGRGGGGYLDGCGGQPDGPSPAGAERTTDQPEATGAERGGSVELDRTGAMGRFIVFPLPLRVDVRDAGAGRRPIKGLRDRPSGQTL